MYGLFTDTPVIDPTEPTLPWGFLVDYSARISASENQFADASYHFEPIEHEV